MTFDPDGGHCQVCPVPTPEGGCLPSVAYSVGFSEPQFLHLHSEPRGLSNSAALWSVQFISLRSWERGPAHRWKEPEYHPETCHLGVSLSPSLYFFANSLLPWAKAASQEKENWGEGNGGKQQEEREDPPHGTSPSHLSHLSTHCQWRNEMLPTGGLPLPGRHGPLGLESKGGGTPPARRPF